MGTTTASTSASTPAAVGIDSIRRRGRRRELRRRQLRIAIQNQGGMRKWNPTNRRNTWRSNEDYELEGDAWDDEPQ